MDRYVGQRIDGRYNVYEIIGVGGMAVVYKAYDTLNQMTVAIKVLKDEYLNNEEFCRRFRNESKAVAMLNHPNIVKVFDVKLSQNLQYIVMEYINGITLKEYIEQQRVVRWKEAVHFTIQILRALQHAHNKGIIHRDIKPQNIMLLEDGSIKVTDFGIAKFTGSETRTITDKAIGSVHYIAPEQARGGKTDERSDIYSVGVILYEMLTGKLPFEADNAVSVAVMQLQSEPKLPRSINNAIPEGLEEITMHAMQKNLDQRYQSATGMLKDIEEFKRNPSIRFEYQYFVDERPTKYVDAINRVKSANAAEEYEERSPVIPVISGIAVAFILVALVFVLITFDMSGIFGGNTDKQVVLPNFEGQNYEEVVGNSAYKFDFIKEEIFSSEDEDGVIISQSPKGEKKVYEHSVVTLTISKGPERLIVPDVVNKNFNEASAEILGLKLFYNRIDVYDDKISEGYVVNTHPIYKTDVEEGTYIDVYVSKGPEEDVMIMPNCVNLSLNQAKAKLNKMGLTVLDTTEIDSDKPKGTIISQSPEYPQKVKEGAKVSFTVSNGNSPNKTVTLSVPLPETETEEIVNISIIVDGKVKVNNEAIVPSMIKKYDYTLSGSGTSEVLVKLGKNNYKKYSVDFTSGKATLTKDYGYTAPTTPTSPTPPASPSENGGAANE